MEDKKSKLKELALEMFAPEQRGTVHENQFCIKPPVHFPDTYIEEFCFHTLTYYELDRENKIHIGYFKIIFSGSITQKFETTKLELFANVYEIYLEHSPQNKPIPDGVLFKFILSGGNEESAPFNIVLYDKTFPGITQEIQDTFQPYFAIPCIDPMFTSDNEPLYNIKFLYFSYFKDISILSYQKFPIVSRVGKGPVTTDPNSKVQPHFMPNILIFSQNKPLKIDNLSTWLTDNHDPTDDLKIWLLTHQAGRAFDPLPFIFDRFFLHGYDIKFDKWQLHGAAIETVLFSSSIAFLTQNKNDPDIQEILSSIKLNFDEQKLKDLLIKDQQNRFSVSKSEKNKMDSNSQQLNPKIIQEHINVYEYLLNDPNHAHQRDELHRYIAYFRSRLSWRKKIIFWLTGDYFRVTRPLLCALGLYIVHIFFQNCTFFKETFPIYEILNFSHLQNKNICKITSITMTNIIRWVTEAGIGYCIFAAGVAIKKLCGMGNSKDFFSSHSI